MQASASRRLQSNTSATLMLASLLAILLIKTTESYIIDWDQYYRNQEYPKYENYSLQTNRAYFEETTTIKPVSIFTPAPKQQDCEYAESECKDDGYCRAAADLREQQCFDHKSFENSTVECPVECRYAHVLLASTQLGKNWMNVSFIVLQLHLSLITFFFFFLNVNFLFIILLLSGFIQSTFLN